MTAKTANDIDNPDSLDIDLKELYSPKSKYTPEQKIEAVAAYMITGTIKSAAKICGIPRKTVSDWKNQALWWDDTLRECRKKKQDELDANFTGVIHTAVGKLLDRVEQGDPKLQKDGSIISIPMSGRDLAISMSILFDKRALLRGDPTSKVEKTSERERLEQLSKQFTEMTNKVQEAGLLTKTVEGEVIVTEETE